MIESDCLKTEDQKFDSGNNIEQLQTSLSHTVMRKTCGQSPEVNSKFSGTLMFIYLIVSCPDTKSTSSLAGENKAGL